MLSLYWEDSMRDALAFSIKAIPCSILAKQLNYVSSPQNENLVHKVLYRWSHTIE